MRFAGSLSKDHGVALAGIALPNNRENAYVGPENQPPRDQRLDGNPLWLTCDADAGMVYGEPQR